MIYHYITHLIVTSSFTGMEGTTSINPADERNDTTKVVHFNGRWYSKEEVNESMAITYAQELSCDIDDTNIKDLVNYYGVNTDTMCIAFVSIEEAVINKRCGSLLHRFFRDYMFRCDCKNCPFPGGCPCVFMHIDLTKHEGAVVFSSRVSYAMMTWIQEFHIIADVTGIPKLPGGIIILCRHCVINAMTSLGAEQLDVRNRSRTNTRSGRDAGRSAKSDTLYFSMKKRIQHAKKAEQ